MYEEDTYRIRLGRIGCGPFVLDKRNLTHHLS